MALQELVLSVSPALTSLHDLRTGSLLTSFKGVSGGSDFSGGSNEPQASSSSSTYGRAGGAKGKGRAVDDKDAGLFKRTAGVVETASAAGGIVASVVEGKAAINVWSFQKESPLHRLILPVKPCCMALSSRGTYLACGAQDGRIFIWEVATGAMVGSFDAHYRAVTCLAWTDDEAALISGGDDAACHVWSIAIILTSAANTMTPIPPFTSLTDHTLALTSIDVSFGTFPRIKLLTSSLDGTCKIWDLSLRISSLLSTFSFNALGTTRVTGAVWDKLERSFYATLAYLPTAAQKEPSGKVVKVDLYRPVRENENMDQLDDDEEEGQQHQQIRQQSSIEESNAPHQSWKALGGGGRGDLEPVAESNASALGYSFSVTSDHISSVQLSHLSSHLLVGTQSGKIHVLALPSMQTIRTIVPSQTSSLSSLVSPVTFLQSMLRPLDLISRTGASHASGNRGNEAEILPRAVAPQFSRTLMLTRSKEADERAVDVRLTGNVDSRGAPSAFAIDEIVLPRNHRNARRQQRGKATAGGPALPGTQNLQDENARLREQLAQAVAFNDRMWESIVDGTLAAAKADKEKAMANGSYMQLDA